MTTTTQRKPGMATAWLFGLWLAFAALLPHPAAAQSATQGLTEADKQQIKDYKLNEDVFGRLMAATKEARTQGIRSQATPDPTKVHNLDDLAAQAMSGDARIAPLIKKYGFSPREFMLANIALMNAAIVVQSRSDPAVAKAIDQSKVNMANVTFYESHQAKIAALMGGGQ
ncbi:hypothetical protein [Dyella subtropica]|uniref:hypothetical protein n=1 Tax=Dyella subtropica TaxID=2992127 RepID=UPI0022549553|nr:hypothetical protein [Dyella subtropica]